MLPIARHTYRIVIRTSTGATPYSLAYVMKVMMSLKVEILSLRILIDSELE
jgi:hypothetical protein